MRNLENDPEHWARVGLEYYGRYRQVVDLSQKMRIQILKERDGLRQPVTVLGQLLVMPPYLLKLHLDRSALTREEYVDTIDVVTTRAFKLCHLGAILENLEDAAEGSNSRELTLDRDYNLSGQFNQHSLTFINPEALRHLTKFIIGDSNRVDEAINLGKQGAVKTLLERIAKQDTPLERWILKMAGHRMELTRTLDYGHVGFLDTNLEGVDVRYYYPPGAQNPTLSLMVKAL